MASKQFMVDIDGQKLNILKDWRINPLTSAQITALAGTLVAGNVGLVVWDTTLSKQLTWDGAAFIDSNTVASALVYKGAVAFDSAEPSSPSIGWFYKFTTSGVNTWNAVNLTVVAGDEVYYDGTDWQLISNESSVAATETVAGILKIATSAESNAGIVDNVAVTPLKLQGYATSKQLAKSYFGSAVLVANTPTTVTHNLQLSNKNAFTINVMDAGDSQVTVDVDSISINSLSVTSNIAATVSVFVAGY